MASAEGGAAPAAEKPPRVLQKLPKIPRGHPGLPSWSDLPEDFQGRYVDKTRRNTAFARLYCIYGVGDSAGQWMRDFVNNGAKWCEMVVYELKGHGVREDEPFDGTYEERAQDLWEALEPALRQQVPGGPAENCPWAIFAHSAGCVLATLLGARARQELGLEPDTVFMVDQAPPDCPFNTEEGYALMCKGFENEIKVSFDWMTVWFPHIAKMKGKNKLGDQVYERWSHGMRLLDDWYRASEQAYHIFHCPIYVFAGQISFLSEEQHNKIREQKRRGWPEKKREGLPTREETEAVSIDEYKSWEKWTTATVEFFPVPAAHNEIWYHQETETKLWQKFLKLSGVTPALIKSCK